MASYISSIQIPADESFATYEIKDKYARESLSAMPPKAFSDLSKDDVDFSLFPKIVTRGATDYIMDIVDDSDTGESRLTIRKIENQGAVSEYLTFTAAEYGTVPVQMIVENPDDLVTIPQLEYSVWNKRTWSDWQDFTPGSTVIGLTTNAAPKCRIKAKTGVTNSAPFWANSTNYIRFMLPKKVMCSGNLMSLVSEDMPVEIPSNNMFRELFCSTKTLWENLGLLTAPELPAVTLKSNCYLEMFNRCYNMVVGPSVLPSPTGATGCYQSMFKSCKAMQIAPKILLTQVNNTMCLTHAFFQCPSIRSIYLGMTSVKSAPNNSMDLMCGCDGTSSEINKYQPVINRIEVNFSEWPTNSGATTDWFQSAPNSGVFICPASLGTDETIERGHNRVPFGWKVVNYDMSANRLGTASYNSANEVYEVEFDADKIAAGQYTLKYIGADGRALPRTDALQTIDVS